MYFRRRFRHRRPGSFVEVGCGSGGLSRELLRMGWRGEGWDLSEQATALASETNRTALAERRYRVHHGDWLEAHPERTDLVVASMVLEHIEEDGRFLERCRASQGELVLFVPGSPRHWGVEDDLAGHVRRYTRTSLRDRLERSGYRVAHLAGLTFPVSNLLLPLSNVLVRRAESDRGRLSRDERTLLSGTRRVPFKTSFPRAGALVLNRFVLSPFHVLQLLGRGSDRALVLYAEARPLS